ncbi:flagellar assembly protein A, partial [Campylobacter jejuni]
KTIQITVAQGIDPIESQDESLILTYKEKTKNYTIDEKRSGIIVVDENEVVLKHAKFKQGKEGKDLNLHTLKVLAANENKVKFSCSSAFKQVEQDGYTEYIALKKGYVVQDGEKFDIANELDFNGVDFKNIGIIRAGLDKNVKINIKFLSEVKDAVNSGVGIECEELNVVGSVGSNTQLNATKMKIEGTTHSKAKIQAKQAYIKTHRGFAEAEILNIDLLEGGTIKAKEVRIKKSLGGNIQADKIYIENLESNNSCVFFENTTIERINGDNNKFHAKIKTLDKNYDEEF